MRKEQPLHGTEHHFPNTVEALKRYNLSILEVPYNVQCQCLGPSKRDQPLDKPKKLWAPKVVLLHCTLHSRYPA